MYDMERKIKLSQFVCTNTYTGNINNNYIIIIIIVLWCVGSLWSQEPSNIFYTVPIHILL